jgi:hypothetical protein
MNRAAAVGRLGAGSERPADHAVFTRRQVRAAAMVIALPNRRVNRIPQPRENPRKMGIFAIWPVPVREVRSDSIHPDT